MFRNFVQMNRKILRLSLRIFYTKYVNLLLNIADNSSKVKILSIYNRNRKIITKHTQMIFFLLYLRFGNNHVTLRIIESHLRSVIQADLPESDEEAKLIFMMFVHSDINILKFEYITHSMVEKSNKNPNNLHLYSKVVHEALLYEEIARIIPDDTIRCVNYGIVSKRKYRLPINNQMG